jgi:membrane protein
VTSRRTPWWAIAFAGALQLGGAKPRRDLSRADASRISGPAAHSRTQHLSKEQFGSNRGRHADSPAEIPAQGWKDIAYRIYHGISEDRIIAISAGVTFFVLLALFPGIAGLISLYGLFADSTSIGKHLQTLSGVLPEGATQIIGEQIQRLTSQPAQKLGFGMITGLVISVWSANGGMKAMFDALNIVYHEKERRGFFRLNAISLALTFGALGS